MGALEVYDGILVVYHALVVESYDILDLGLHLGFTQI